jgi:hypothetical protein
MDKKAQELDARTLMQGLEEFATFMSFKGDSSGIRILSVETVNHSPYLASASPKDNVIKLQQRHPQHSEKHTLSNTFSISDSTRH